MNQARRLEEQLLHFIERGTPESLAAAFAPGGPALGLLATLPSDSIRKILVLKNVKVFGGINQYVNDFLPKVESSLLRMAEGDMKEKTKQGQRALAEVMLVQPELSDENKARLLGVIHGPLAAAAAGGKRRKYGRKSTRRKKSLTKKSRTGC